MKRIVNKFSLGVLLWSLTALAWANGPFGGSATNDVAIKYLGEVFGHVPGALDGSGAGIMSQLFYVFNQGIMVVAAAWLVYSVTNMMLGSTLTHQGMQKHSVPMVAFRVALGMLMLVPNPINGYSAAQTVMMNVVVEGSNLADKTWSYALDYMNNGGVIYAPINAKNGTLTKNSLTSYMNSSGQGYIADVYQNEVCMYLSNSYREKLNPKDVGGQKYNLIAVEPQMQADGVTPNPATGKVFFPGYNDSTDPAQHGQSCGVVSVNYSMFKNATQTQYNQAFNAIYQMAMDIQPLAKAQAKYIIASQDSKTATPMSATVGGQMLFQAFYDYATLMKPVAGYVAVQANKSKTNFIQTAKDDGWFDAGSFYWNLARLNDAISSHPDPTTYTPTILHWAVPVTKIQTQIMAAKNSLGNSNPVNIWGNGMARAYNYISNLYTNASSSDEKQGVNGWKPGKVHGPSTAEQIYSWTGVGMVTNMLGITHFDDFDYQGAIKGAMGVVLNKLSSLMFDQTKNSYDPLVFVQQLGQSCMQATGDLWADTMSAATSWAGASARCAAQSGHFSQVSTQMGFVLPLLTAIAGSLFTAGFMLTFYVPLYPYLLFLFGSLGWLLTVVEAMTATPLVCFGMTHPEGHDFMGKAEQALMLALGVFLRPTLMVIGFIAGMLLSYIACDFVNTVLGRVFISAFAQPTTLNASGQPIYNGTTNWAPLDAVWLVVNGGVNKKVSGNYTGSQLADLILIPLLLVAYGMIMVEVVNQAFSAIHQVPDMVLRWIGGPVMQDQSEKYAQAIKSGMQQSAQKGGQLGGDMMAGKAKTKVARATDEGQTIGGVAKAGMQAEMG